MQFQRYKNFLLRSLGEDVVKILKASNAIIAGGSITSIFTNSEINDYDIYFRSREDIMVFIRNIFNVSNDHGYAPATDPSRMIEEKLKYIRCDHMSKKSISFVDGNHILQLIHFDYFEDAHAIFESYDFCHNMGAYDFAIDDFVFHERFIEDVAARRMTFNPKTQYPIMTLQRVEKYKERGYSINRKELFKIGMACSELNINTWEELEDQLSGFYGIDVSKLFDKTIEFSMDAAYDMLEKVYELPKIEYETPTIDMIIFSLFDNPYKDIEVFYTRANYKIASGEMLYSFSYNEHPSSMTYPVQDNGEGNRVFPTIEVMKNQYGLMSNQMWMMVKPKPNSDMRMTSMGLYVSGELEIVGFSTKR